MFISCPGFSHAQEETFYFLTDHLGSVEVVLDENANVVERRDYLPYGTSRVPQIPRPSHVSDTVEPRSFTGKQLDTQTGLHYYSARYYDSEIGRFTTIDPLVLDEAKTTPEDLLSILSNPQKLNAYTYVSNNPLMYTDPFGESEFTEQWAGVGKTIDGLLHFGLGTSAVINGATTMVKIGGVAVQKTGEFEMAWGVAQMTTGNSLQINATESIIAKGTGKVVAYTTKGLGAAAKSLSYVSGTGYEEVFESIGEMIENEVTFPQFVNSIGDAVVYEVDNAFEKIDRAFQKVDGLINNSKNDADEKRK